MRGFDGLGECLEGTARHARACFARPFATLCSLLKSALVGGAVLGLVQPAMAVQIVFDPGINPGTGQGIYAALLDLDRADARPVDAPREDNAFAALVGF